MAGEGAAGQRKRRKRKRRLVDQGPGSKGGRGVELLVMVIGICYICKDNHNICYCHKDISYLIYPNIYG